VPYGLLALGLERLQRVGHPQGSCLWRYEKEFNWTLLIL